jgi:hypothetical protein
MATGSTGPKAKTPDQLLTRRKLVSELYLQCLSLAEIGKQLGVSAMTVYKDMQYCREQWRTRITDNMELLRQRELGRIDHLELEYWRGFQRTVGVVKIYKEESGTGAQGPIAKNSVTRERKAGDPRFLDGVQKCIEQRRKILGLDAPSQVQVGGIDNVMSVLQARIARVDSDTKSTTIEQKPE